MQPFQQISDFDCGDGVPNLPRFEQVERPAPNGVDGPVLNAPIVVMGLVLVGQLVLLLAVVAGGDPVIGAVAGLALLVCGLLIIGVRQARRALDRI